MSDDYLEWYVEKEFVTQMEEWGWFSLKGDHLKRGFPDRILLGPEARTIIVEFKRRKAPKKRKGEKLQKHFRDKFYVLGFEVFVVRGMEESKTLLKKFDPVERWTSVVGWKDLYEVSSMGFVRSLGVRRGSDGRILSSRSNSRGALRVRLHRKNCVEEKYVHRLVLEAFVGPCPDEMECCHGPNYDKSDNRLCNLRWDTHYNNGQDYAKIALTEPVIKEVCTLFEDGRSAADLSRQYGVSHNRIMRLLRNYYDF